MTGLVLSLLPSWWSRLAVAALLCVAVWGHGWMHGASHVQAEWDRQIAAAGVIQNRIAVRQAQATERIVEQYVDRVRIVNVKGEAVIRAIPQFIPVDACPASGAERLLLDAAASGGAVPDAAAIADAAPSAAAEVTRTVAENYESCRANAEQLTSLQAWIRAQLEASK